MSLLSAAAAAAAVVPRLCSYHVSSVMETCWRRSGRFCWLFTFYCALPFLTFSFFFFLFLPLLFLLFNYCPLLMITLFSSVCFWMNKCTSFQLLFTFCSVCYLIVHLHLVFFSNLHLCLWFWPQLIIFSRCRLSFLIFHFFLSKSISHLCSAPVHGSISNVFIVCFVCSFVCFYRCIITSTWFIDAFLVNKKERKCTLNFVCLIWCAFEFFWFVFITVDAAAAVYLVDWLFSTLLCLSSSIAFFSSSFIAAGSVCVKVSRVAV